MHISDGVLSNEVMIACNVIAAVGAGLGLYNLDYEKIPRVGVFASAFFVASLIHVNLGPSSVHLMLNGLLGIILGWAAFPALAAALFLQAIILGFGGVTSLGCNILNTALPAILCYYMFRGLCLNAKTHRAAVIWGGVAGAFGVIVTCATVALSLYCSNAEAFSGAITAILVGHIPVMVIEAIVVGATVGFLRKVRPEILKPSSN